MSYGIPKSVIVTDLDNTLWDWFDAWYQSFSAMLARLTELSGVPQIDLERQIREIHQAQGTTEYSWLVCEVPALIAAAVPGSPEVVFDEAVRVLNSRRKAATKLYPGVRSALDELKKQGVRIVAYTESVSSWTEWRVRRTGLDGVIDALYSTADHNWLAGVTTKDVRMLPSSEYQLRQTRHKYVPRGMLKPNGEVLHSILREQRFKPEQAVYIGDSLMKDVAMAQEAGVLDVHAEYGQVQNKAEYELLRRVSHWSDADVARERHIAQSAGTITPTIICRHSFAEVIPLFSSTASLLPRRLCFTCAALPAAAWSPRTSTASSVTTIKVRGANGEQGRAPRRSTRPYLFRGLINCGLCGRYMVGNLNHGRLYYRCKASRDFVRQHEAAHPPMLYLREDTITDPIDRFLHQELNGRTLAANLRALADAHHRAELAAYRANDEPGRLRQTITDCDAKIERYRAALDAGGDPALIAGWIREASTVRSTAEAALRVSATPPQRLNDDQIAAIVDGLGSLFTVLRGADPRDKAELYSRIGLRMVYQPGPKTLKAEIVSTDLGRVLNVCPRPNTWAGHTVIAARGLEIRTLARS